MFILFPFFVAKKERLLIACVFYCFNHFPYTSFFILFLFVFYFNILYFIFSPEMKKSMQALQKQIQDLQRKESDHKRNANDAQKQFEKACQDLGIKVKSLQNRL